jgi:hypothetical protein
MKASANSPVAGELVWVGTTLMSVEASDEVRVLLKERGGSLYLWTTVHGCCQGRITLLEAATSRPPNPGLRFQRAIAGGFDLFLDLSGRPVPERLVLEARGRHRKIAAYWNNQAYVG